MRIGTDGDGGALAQYPRPAHGSAGGVRDEQCYTPPILRRVGPPREIYDQPANLFGADFMGTANSCQTKSLVRRMGWRV